MSQHNQHNQRWYLSGSDFCALGLNSDFGFHSLRSGFPKAMANYERATFCSTPIRLESKNKSKCSAHYYVSLPLRSAIPIFIRVPTSKVVNGTHNAF